VGFTELFREARKRDEYWIEDAIVGFTSQLYSIMRRKGISVTALAERLGVAQPYITRVLKGRDNLTIATMVKLARAAGIRLQISLLEETEASLNDEVVRVPLEVRREQEEAAMSESSLKRHRGRKG
jgi:transcriptional regulator with XRE-family HTH domain